MENKGEYNKIILAAFLHDLGKFAQRAEVEKLKSKDLEGQLCKPTNYGGYSHQHVLYTEGALREILDVFPVAAKPKEIPQLAASHHNPSSNLDYIITEADWISSGTDRIDKELEDEIKKRFYETPLKSIISNLGKEKETTPLYHKLRTLEPDNIFPLQDKEVKVNKEEYRKHWESFMEDIKKLDPEKPFYNYLLSLDTLLERYLWCIPSTTFQEPDISLYDHSRTTAAFAAVLYRYHEESGTLDKEERIKDYKEKKFLFVTGDFSGIQNYLFNLKTTELNAKLLRARSFEIQLEADSIINFILKEFDLPHFCALINGGGRFLLVLPNIKEVASLIDSLRKSIETFFIKNYFGELTCNLSQGVKASKEDLHQKNFKKLFYEISHKAGLAKQKKLQAGLSVYGPLLINEYNNFHGNPCPICEDRPISQENYCTTCNKLIKYGTSLPKSEYISIAYTTEKDYKSPKIQLSGTKPKEDFDLTFSINRYRSGFPILKLPYHIPIDDKSGEPLTFEELERMHIHQKHGIENLAMLKADVDNLGHLFSQGFGEKGSISRYASLSRILHYFFATFLNSFIVSKEDFSKTIYVVFSGGDDLCIIGPWDMVIEFAREFHKEFKKFTAGNKAVTISAGLSLASHKIPVRQLAEEAESQLETSKKSKTREKNKITVFDTPVSWNIFEELINQGEYLIGKMEDGSVSRSFIYKLLGYRKRAIDFKISGVVTEYNALWKSHLVYNLERNIRDDKNKKEEVKELKERIKSLCTEQDIESINIPVNYALYATRGSKKNSKEELK